MFACVQMSTPDGATVPGIDVRTAAAAVGRHYRSRQLRSAARNDLLIPRMVLHHHTLLRHFT